MEDFISRLEINDLTLLVTSGLKDPGLQSYAENRLFELYTADEEAGCNDEDTYSNSDETFSNYEVSDNEDWKLPVGISVEEEIGNIFEKWMRQPLDPEEERLYRRDMAYLKWLEMQQPDEIRNEEEERNNGKPQTLEEWCDEEPGNFEYLQEVMDWLNGNEDEVKSRQAPMMKRITLVKQIERHVRRFNITGREYTLRVNDEDMSFHDFHALFDELLDWILSDFQPDDMVGIQLWMEGLDNVIFYPFSRADQITSQRLLDTVEKVVQSNTKISLKNIEIKVVRVKLPQGGGRPRLSHSSVADFLKRKRCLVTVSGERNLCFGRCLALGICLHTKNQNEFHKLHNANATLTSEAKQLYIKAGVALGPVGLKEIQRFQASLPEYQLLVYEDNRLIFKGARNEKQIFLLLAENHYYLIKSMTGFLCKKYFCNICLKGYDKKNGHKCYNICYYCNSSPVCEKGDYQYCEDCNRVFPSTICYQKHKNNDSCRKYVTCPDCCKVIERARLHSHSCGFFTCKNCKNSVREGHKCFITIPKNCKILDGPLIVFDCESTQDTVYNSNSTIHRINLIVSKRICKNCVKNFSTEPCINCEERVFSNEAGFCDYVFTERNKNGVCLSHYGKGYDTQFIIRYLLENNKIPSVIATGSKFLCAEYKGIRLLDSHSFIPMKLSSLPKAFGFPDNCKGYFPHLFNTDANKNYTGPIPDVSFYDVNGMIPDVRKDFLTWYQTQQGTVFDMKTEILKYCKNDVEILVKAALIYRNMFYNVTQIDPFTCMTLPQACLEVYRKNFMPKDSIGVFPTVVNKYSHIALKWLLKIEEERGISIQHALNGGEKKIGPYFVDGFYQGTVFSFHGCFYHGCPVCYKQRDVKPFADGLTHQERYDRTVSRKLFFQKLGYNVEEMWECQFKDYENVNIIEPINSRESLYGGRVEVFKTFVEGEPINYIDITSLYPFVNKTCYYPLGHPEIIKSKFSDIREYNGIIKCKILPPQNLYILLLPARINKKLLFVLCRTCAANKLTETCNHSEDERSLTGVWCTPELHKALSLGYKIVEIYEVWNFKDGMNGLFEGYVKTFLKIKQESSGWPENCISEEQRQNYIEEYLKHEGISLDPSKIEKNLGLRTLSKLILNNIWGKLSQRVNLPTIEFVNDPEKFFSLFADSSKIVNAVDIMTDKILKVTHQSNDETMSFRNNVIIGAFTTSHARLILYSYLEKLGDRVIYVDTDSVVYKGNADIPLSSFLGGMTNEVPEALSITKFIGVGPKSYGYELSDGSTVLKLKGITLSYRNREIINIDLLEKMVKYETDGVTVVDPVKISRTKQCQVITSTQTKNFKMVFDKRCLRTGYDTMPWGYKSRAETVVIKNDKRERMDKFNWHAFYFIESEKLYLRVADGSGCGKTLDQCVAEGTAYVQSEPMKNLKLKYTYEIPREVPTYEFTWSVMYKKFMNYSRDLLVENFKSEKSFPCFSDAIVDFYSGNSLCGPENNVPQLYFEIVEKGKKSRTGDFVNFLLDIV